MPKLFTRHRASGIGFHIARPDHHRPAHHITDRQIIPLALAAHQRFYPPSSLSFGAYFNFRAFASSFITPSILFMYHTILWRIIYIMYINVLQYIEYNSQCCTRKKCAQRRCIYPLPFPYSYKTLGWHRQNWAHICAQSSPTSPGSAEAHSGNASGVVGGTHLHIVELR